MLAAHAQLSQLFDLPAYAGVEADILTLLNTLGVLTNDEGEFARLRKLRGQLLKRPRTGPVQVVATGRASWIGEWSSRPWRSTNAPPRTPPASSTSSTPRC